MPNWVFNTVKISGPVDEIQAIKDRLNKPYTRMHNTWDPKTQSYTREEVRYDNPVFSFLNIVAPTDWEAYDSPADMDNATNPLNWYNFNNSQWGTKWDVACANDSDTSLIRHDIDNDVATLVYSFDTAWSPPAVALEKLSALVPNSVVHLDWQEEQGFGGTMDFADGQLDSETYYESMCVECDELDCIEYCETCEINVCSKCGYTDDNVSEDCEEHNAGN